MAGFKKRIMPRREDIEMDQTSSGFIMNYLLQGLTLIAVVIVGVLQHYRVKFLKNNLADVVANLSVLAQINKAMQRWASIVDVEKVEKNVQAYKRIVDDLKDKEIKAIEDKFKSELKAKTDDERSRSSKALKVIIDESIRPLVRLSSLFAVNLPMDVRSRLVKETEKLNPELAEFLLGLPTLNDGETFKIRFTDELTKLRKGGQR